MACCSVYKNISIGMIKQFHELLNPDINTLDPEGRTPLCLAAESGNMEMFNFLLECGADIHIPDINGSPPLNYACGRDRFDMAQILLSKGCSLTELKYGTKVLPIHFIADDSLPYR